MIIELNFIHVSCVIQWNHTNIPVASLRYQKTLKERRMYTRVFFYGRCNSPENPCQDYFIVCLVFVGSAESPITLDDDEDDIGVDSGDRSGQNDHTVIQISDSDDDETVHVKSEPIDYTNLVRDLITLGSEISRILDLLRKYI